MGLLRTGLDGLDRLRRLDLMMQEGEHLAGSRLSDYKQPFTTHRDIEREMDSALFTFFFFNFSALDLLIF